MYIGRTDGGKSCMELCVFRKGVCARACIYMCMRWCRCNELERNPQSSSGFRRVCHILSATIRRKRGLDGGEEGTESGMREEGKWGNGVRSSEVVNHRMPSYLEKYSSTLVLSRGCKGWLYHTAPLFFSLFPSCRWYFINFRPRDTWGIGRKTIRRKKIQ